MGRKSFLIILVLIGLGLIFSFGGKKAFGASFPEKPIKFIVNFRAGSGVDTEARGIAPYVEKYLGVPVAIENVEGASGKVGLTRVWKAKPDGYTWVIQDTPLALIGEHVLAPDYRIADFTHIFAWSLTNQVLVVNSESWKTFDEFVKAGRERILTVALPGKGTASELSALIMAEGLGIKLNAVPFDGGAEALAALAGKHVDFASTATTSALPLVKAGKIKPLVVFANSPDIVFPDTPLPKNIGHDFPVMPMIRGIDGPPKMDEGTVKIIEEAFFKVVKDPGYLAWAKNRMMQIVPLNHEEYRKAIENQQKEVEKHKNIFKYAK